MDLLNEIMPDLFGWGISAGMLGGLIPYFFGYAVRKLLTVFTGGC